MISRRRTVPDLMAMKRKEKIAALTAYDYPMAAFLDQAGVDVLLVGDSVGNVIYGLSGTIGVTVEDILRHTQAVLRGSEHALVVADMPFGSYQPSIETAVRNACRFLAEGGAQAVKLEGGEAMAPTIQKLVEIGIPVMAHIGLTPQSVNHLGGFRIHGKDASERERLIHDALAVEKAGAFSVVLECIQPDVAATITQEVRIPTIGIGSGVNCDGQILVSNDLFGMNAGFTPKFVQPLADVKTIVLEATRKYLEGVKGER